MAIDLTGGIDPAREYVFAERPDNPEMRESVSFWVSDDRGEVGLHAHRDRGDGRATGTRTAPGQRGVSRRSGVPRSAQDGKTLAGRGSRRAQPTVFGAGPLGFRCVEPFRTLDDDLRRLGGRRPRRFDLAEGKKDGPLVDVQFEVEATMAVPPWVQGTLVREAGEQLESSIEGDLMGGPRYEQLFRAPARVQVGGRGARVHGQRPAHPAPGRPPARRVLGSLLAVGAVPEREGVRLHGLPAARRRRADVQRGLPLRRRRRPRRRPASSMRPGSRSCSRSTRTCRWCSRPRAARYGSRARPSCRPSTSPQRQVVRRRSHEEGDARLPGAAAGGRALPLGRRRDLRDARALVPARQDLPRLRFHAVMPCRRPVLVSIAIVAAVVWGAVGASAAEGTHAAAAGAGSADTGHAVGVLTATFVDKSRPTAANGDCKKIPSRTLPTTIFYPATGDATSDAAQPGAVPDARGGPYPFIAFAHGFGGDPELYAGLLRHWAANGFVVAAPRFPLSSGASPCGSVAGDSVNQPEDISFVISSVLKEAARRHGPPRRARRPSQGRGRRSLQRWDHHVRPRRQHCPA